MPPCCEGSRKWGFLYCSGGPTQHPVPSNCWCLWPGMAGQVDITICYSNVPLSLLSGCLVAPSTHGQPVNHGTLLFFQETTPTTWCSMAPCVSLTPCFLSFDFMPQHRSCHYWIQRSAWIPNLLQDVTCHYKNGVPAWLAHHSVSRI